MSGFALSSAHPSCGIDVPDYTVTIKSAGKNDVVNKCRYSSESPCPRKTQEVAGVTPDNNRDKIVHHAYTYSTGDLQKKLFDYAKLAGYEKLTFWKQHGMW